MNIFASYECPIKSAQYLDTLRCNKMILESAQILSTVLFEHGGVDKFIKWRLCTTYPTNYSVLLQYKPKKIRFKYNYFFKGTNYKAYSPTHRKHPATIWAGLTKANYEWTLAHMKALAEEYYRRRGKWHKSYLLLFKKLSQYSSYVPTGVLTPFANCAARQDMGISFKHIEDTHEAYRQYLQERWKNDVRTPVWK